MNSQTPVTHTSKKNAKRAEKRASERAKKEAAAAKLIADAELAAAKREEERVAKLAAAAKWDAFRESLRKPPLFELDLDELSRIIRRETCVCGADFESCQCGTSLY